MGGKERKKNRGAERERESFEEFRNKYPDLQDFFEKKSSRFNANKDEIYFHSYLSSENKITLFVKSAGENEGRKKEMNLERFERFLRNFPFASKEEIKAKKTDSKEPEKTSSSEPKEIVIDDKEKESEIGKKSELALEENKPEAKDERLEELEQAVVEARKAYAAKDYEVTNSLANIRKIIGKLRMKPRDVPDTRIYYEEYQSSLKDLLDYRLGKLKEKKSMSRMEEDFEVNALIKYFNQDEKLNLYGERTNVKAEFWEKSRFGRMGNRLKTGSEKYFNWYRKIGWKKKVFFGAAAGLAGFGIPMRIAGAAVAGAGLTKGLNERYGRKEEKRFARERADIKEDFDVNSDMEKRYADLMGRMQSEIDGYQDYLKGEKNRARKRKIYGAMMAAGVLLGGEGVHKLLDWGLDGAQIQHYMSQASESMKEFFGKVGEESGVKDIWEKYGWGGGDASIPPAEPDVSSAPPAEPDIRSVPPDQPAPGKSPVPPAEILPQDVPVQESAEKVMLTVDKGSSFQGEIIEKLKEKGMDPGEAGKKAHLAYLEHIDKHPDPTGRGYEVIHPNARLELEFDAKGDPHVVSFEDSPKSMWDTEVVKGESEVQNVPESDRKMPDILSQESASESGAPLSPEPPSALEHNLQPADGIETAGTSQVNVSGSGPGGVEIEAGVAGGILAAEAVKKGARESKKVIKFPGAEERKERTKKKKLSKAEGKFEKHFHKLAKKYDLKMEDGFMARARRFVTAVSLGSVENWSVMKNTKKEDMENILSSKLVKNIKKFEKDIIGVFGDAAKLREKETLKTWMSRVVNMSIVKVEGQTVKTDELERQAA